MDSDEQHIWGKLVMYFRTIHCEQISLTWLVDYSGWHVNTIHKTQHGFSALQWKPSTEFVEKFKAAHWKWADAAPYAKNYVWFITPKSYGTPMKASVFTVLTKHNAKRVAQQSDARPRWRSPVKWCKRRIQSTYKGIPGEKDGLEIKDLINEL